MVNKPSQTTNIRKVNAYMYQLTPGNVTKQNCLLGTNISDAGNGKKKVKSLYMSTKYLVKK